MKKIVCYLLSAIVLLGAATGCPPQVPPEIIAPVLSSQDSLVGRLILADYKAVIGIMNATVTLRQVESNTTFTTSTDDGGYYRFRDLQPGTYEITPTKLHWLFMPGTEPVTLGDTSLSVKDILGTGTEGYIADPWGYIWDEAAQPAASWQDAYEDCQKRGGRLPTATEIYRNAHHKAGKAAIGSAADSLYHWTNLLNDADNHLALRFDTGEFICSNATRVYRCIWPDRERDTFSGSYVYTEPGEMGFPTKWYN